MRHQWLWALGATLDRLYGDHTQGPEFATPFHRSTTLEQCCVVKRSLVADCIHPDVGLSDGKTSGAAQVPLVEHCHGGTT